MMQVLYIYYYKFLGLGKYDLRLLMFEVPEKKKFETKKPGMEKIEIKKTNIIYLNKATPTTSIYFKVHLYFFFFHHLKFIDFYQREN
jgi:hypothetical protein